jgi:probable rRNA maturation factor
MNSSDDPDRDRTPANKNGVHVTTNWSRAARREYSAPSDTTSAAKLGSLAKRAARACLAHLQANHSALEKFAPAQTFTLDISFVGDEEIRELNATYRGKNKPTDVLSFAQTEGEAFAFEQDSHEVLLGDVVIAIGVAECQARELHYSLEYEIAFLTVHGVLHLCGFDHDTSSRRRTMWKLQDAIVATLFPSSDSSLCSSR